MRGFFFGFWFISRQGSSVRGFFLTLTAIPRYKSWMFLKEKSNGFCAFWPFFSHLSLHCLFHWKEHEWYPGLCRHFLYSFHRSLVKRLDRLCSQTLDLNTGSASNFVPQFSYLKVGDNQCFMRLPQRRVRWLNDCKIFTIITTEYTLYKSVLNKY